MIDENFILKVDQIVCKSKTEALYWLRDIEQKFNGDEPVKLRSSKKSSSKRSKSSASSSSGSSRKSVRDRMVEEAAKLASVKAEADYAVNLATLKAEKEIAKREAKMKVYEQFVNTDDVSLNGYEPFLSFLKQSDDSISKQELKKKSSLNPEAESFKTRELDKSVKQPRVHDHKDSNIIPDHKNNFSNTISNLLKLQSAPEISIDTFGGDPLEFKYFMATFEEVIESKIDEARGRLTRLIQYVLYNIFLKIYALI